jgi:hypothetical protein
MEFLYGNNKMTGNLSYNELKGIITLTLENKKRTLNLVITEIVSNKLRGVMVEDNSYENAFDALLTSE